MKIRKIKYKALGVESRQRHQETMVEVHRFWIQIVLTNMVALLTSQL